MSPAPITTCQPAPGSLAMAIGAYVSTSTLRGASKEWKVRQRKILDTFQNWASLRGIEEVPEIRPHHIDAFMGETMDIGLSLNTARTRGVIVRAAVRHALRAGLVERAPAAFAILPEPERPHLDIPSLRAAFTVADTAPEPFRTFFLVSLGSGLRRGEVLHLRWTDVDETQAVAMVLCRKEWKTKTRRDRAAGISPWAMEALLRRRETLADLGFHGPFLDEYGRPLWNGSFVSRKWRRHADKHSLDGVRLHDLRHAHATELLSRCKNLREVQAQLGHSRITTTERYTHPDTATPAKLGRLLADLS